MQSNESTSVGVVLGNAQDAFSYLSLKHLKDVEVGYREYPRLINPRRACARVTVLVLSVCVFPILAPRAIRRTNSSISDFSAIRA